ncbi:uncharacterized protein LOC116347714 [Contarinia nasturtii]|uniref:uncharacterized protein LOC116347714 n=1 Tax=Contarinia nasturtii TaxID=265458 RepID=UPI0012D41482|nr:uncharacterized protein LOC116347714 [Contarinia nasturtii]
MADQKANLGVKRQPEGTNEPEPKYPRTGSVTNTKKLTDVVDDCLERIFMHLSVEDLLNIAHTNKQLIPAADLAFQRKFGKMEFQLNNKRYYYSSGDNIKINDKKTQLRLLRCFGHFITKLDLQQSDEFGKKLVDYANEYCFESLTAIKIRWLYIRNDMLQKPFSNIEVVELKECKLYADTNFKKWFPAMRRLELNWSSPFTKGMFIVKNIPQLEHLAIHCNRNKPSENICTSLRNNPQLRSVYLWVYRLPKDFWNTCQTLAQLECLKIYSNANFAHVDTVINFHALKKLDIHTEENDLRLMALEENVITFDQLKDITLHYKFDLLPSIDSHKWSNFFKRNQSIEKVTLWSFITSETSVTIMTEAVQNLPLLKEFNHFGYGYTVNEILRSIGKFSLLSYGFQLNRDSFFDDLKKRLGAEFHASICEHEHKSSPGSRIKVNRR